MIARGTKGKGGYTKRGAKKAQAKKSTPPPKPKGKKQPPPAAPTKKTKAPVKHRAARVTRKDAKKMAREIATDIDEKAQSRARAAAIRERIRKSPPMPAQPARPATKEEEEDDRRAMEKVRKRGKEMLEEAQRVLAARGGSKVKHDKNWPGAGKKEVESVALEDSGLSWDRQEELDNLCKMYRACVQEIKDQEEVKDALFVNIDEIARSVDLGDVHTDQWHLVRATGRTRTISREALLEAGVPIETIEKSMRDKTWEKYQILAPESGESENGES